MPLSQSHCVVRSIQTRVLFFFFWNDVLFFVFSKLALVILISQNDAMAKKGFVWPPFLAVQKAELQTGLAMLCDRPVWINVVPRSTLKDLYTLTVDLARTAAIRGRSAREAKSLCPVFSLHKHAHTGRKKGKTAPTEFRSPATRGRLS